MKSRKLTGNMLYISKPEEEGDIVYRTGFFAPDPVVYFEENARRRHLVVSDLELGRAQRVVSRCRIWTLRDLGLHGPASRRLADRALALLCKLGIRSINVGLAFPSGCLEFLRKNGIAVNVSGDRFFPGREVKTETELRCIRQSQRAANKAMLRAWTLLGTAGVDGTGRLVLDGKKMTSDFLRAEINKMLLEHNCIGTGTIVACGSQAADPHEIGDGFLMAGESIVIDIFPKHLRHGYWGDLTRTFVKGRAKPELRAMYAAVVAARKRALTLLRSGVYASSVHSACVDEFAERGYKTGGGEGFMHSTGHGVGLDVHESPSVAPVKKRLRTGSVVTIEPGLYYRDIGGIRIEDLVVVTRSGFDYVARCRHGFELPIR